MKYKVRDIRLAKKGQISHEWAKNHMPILERTLDRFRKTKPLKGITIGFCLHITKETSVLLLGAKAWRRDDFAFFSMDSIYGPFYLYGHVVFCPFMRDLAFFCKTYVSNLVFHTYSFEMHTIKSHHTLR